MWLLSNADLFAPEPLGIGHLLIAGGRIVWMGSEAPALPASLEVEVFDLDGRRVIPGLVDCHTHLAGGGGETGYASRVPALQLTQLTTAGVTTAVGLLGTDDTVRSTGELLVTARGLRDLGLTTYCWTGGYHLPPRTLTGSVREDMLHLDLVIGAGEVALSDHRSSQPTLEELLRLAGDVHVGGLMTGKAGVLHLHMGDGARGLDLVRQAIDRAEIPARVYHPTHVNRRRALLDEAFALVREGCVIDVTAFPPEAGGAGPHDTDGEDAVPAANAIVAYFEKDLPAHLVTCSSDGGGCLPEFDDQGRPLGMDVGTPATLGDALRGLLEMGVPLERALPPFTSNVAGHLRLGAKGRIAVGADADLVVLDDAGGFRNVFARGRLLVRDGAPLARGPFES